VSHPRSFIKLTALFGGIQSWCPWLWLRPRRFGGLDVPPALHQNVEHDTVLIRSPPEMMLFAVDADENLIQVPSVSGPEPPPAEPLGKLRTERQAPTPDTLVRHKNTVLRLDQFNVAQAQAENT
jgi:hypothetical protein